MKKQTTQTRSRWLFVCLLSLLMTLGGTTSAWGDTLTENFNSLTVSGTALSNGWFVQGATLGTQGSSKDSWGTYQYELVSRDADGTSTYKSLVAAYGSQSGYVIIPVELTGTISFSIAGTKTSSGSYSIHSVTKDGDNFIVGSAIKSGTVSAKSNSSASFGSWTTISHDYSASHTMIALMFNKAAIDNFSATIYEGAINKPKSFALDSKTYNSATFSWTQGGTETAWQLVYSTNSSFDKDATTPIDITENPYTLTGLSPETTYYASLRSKNGSDVSYWVEQISFTTNEQYLKPSDFAASSITATSSSLSWTKNGDETAWQISYSTEENFDPTDAGTKIVATTNPYTLEGLTAETTYYAYVRAKIGESDFSGWSQKINFTTLEAYPKPTSFAVTGFTATTATFGWTVGSSETAWQIAYSTEENFNPTSEGTKVAVTTNPYTLEGLSVETTYYAYIRANYGGNYSGWSDKVSFTPSATLNLLVNDGTTTNSYVPLYGFYADAWTHSQFIIPSTSLTGMTNRQITELTIHSSTASASFTGAVYEVYLMNVDAEATTFGDNTIDWTGMTKVYTGNVSISDNKMLIDFDTPFIYTTGSLMVGFKETTKSSTYPSVSWLGVETAGNTARYLYGSYSTKGFSTFLPKVTITSEEMPDVVAPSGLTKNSVSAFTATLGWIENGEATAWQIALGTTSEFDPDGVVTPIEANANPFTVTGLTAETTYYAYVRAKKGGDTSDWSNKVEFTTPNAKPSNVVIAVSDNSAKFSWTANAGETAWQIKYSTTSEFDPDSEGTLQAVTTNPYTLSGLIPETTYYAYLRADLGGGEYSDWTAKQTFATGFEHTLTVNEGNGTTTSGSVPFYGSYTDYADRGWSQFIIPASQLGTMNGGNVNKITFYTTENITWSTSTNPTFKVYLKEVDNEKFASKEFIDWATMTEIYDGEIAFDGNQLAINLATPHNYTGKNLMIGFKQTTAGGYCNTSWMGTSADNEVGVQNASGATTYNWAAFLPKTTFNYETVTGPRLTVSADALDFGELTQESTDGDKQKTFTISNTGVAELTGLSVAVSGTGYSVSALPRTNITTTGETADPIELTVTLAPTTSGTYNGTVTVSATGQPDKVINLTATYVADPIMGVFNDELATEAATTDQTVNFGYVEAAPTYTYYIKNTGAGTLDIAVTDGGFTVSPSEASLAAGEQQAFTITPNVANADATVTFTGTNHDGGAAIGTFTVTLQGTVMPLTSTFFEGFAYAAGEETPDATTTELPGWEINNPYGVDKTIKFYHSVIYYYASSTETANVVTPKLRVAGTSDVLLVSAYTAYTYSSSKLIISYSADKENWTVAATKTGDSDFDGKTYVTKAFEISGIPEGSYYFKIEMCDVAVDYFYGFSTTLPAALAMSETAAPSLVADVIRDVTLTRSFVAGWNTICLPFAVANADMESKFGTGAKLYDFTGFNESVLSFEQVNTGIEAGKPYLIYVANAIADPITFLNAAISETTAATTAHDGITFQGTYAPIAKPDLNGNYGISKDGRIAKANENTYMNGFRAYLVGDLAGARISTYDEATGISRIYDANEVFGENAKVYNLNGQQVDNAKKGVYIVNGKKVVIK